VTSARFCAELGRATARARGRLLSSRSDEELELPYESELFIIIIMIYQYPHKLNFEEMITDICTYNSC
jgi:hypothetical protein